MFEHVKILIVITVFGLLGFSLAKKIYAESIGQVQFNYWRNAWLLVISAACLASNYWLFTGFVMAFGWYSVGKLKDRAIFLYLFLLPALPMLSNELPGFAGIRMIFEFSYPRILSLAILLPLFFRYKNKILPLRRTATDQYFLMFIIFLIMLSWTRSESITDSLRSMLYVVTDYILPYFVVSRLIDDTKKLQTAFIAIITSVAILASVNIVEHFKYWFVYQELYQSLNISYGGFSAYSMVRDGMLRTSSVFASPIVFGYIAVIVLGFFSGVQVKKGVYYKILFLLLLSALVTPLSRGPWVGFIVLIVIFIWYGPRSSSNLMKLIGYGTLSFLLLLMTPYTSKIINLIPFVGSTDSGNISYRQDLFTSSLPVIKNNLFFGDNNFRSAPELQHLVQGQGIIDIVNTYLQIVLEYGLIGLLLFLLIFLQPIHQLILRLKRKELKDDERYLVMALVAILGAIMVIIATVSQIDYIPIYYLIIIAISRATLNIFKLKTETNE